MKTPAAWISMMLVFASFPVFAGTGITRFAQVTPTLFRGGRPLLSPIDQVAWLKSVGVRTDIDLQGGDVKTPGIGWIFAWTEPGETKANINLEKNHVLKLGLRFVHAPLNSVEDVTNTEAHLIDRILAVMHDPHAQPVFIHCERGVDRTGLLVALYRVKYQHWDIEDAHREMVAMGHDILHQIFTHDMDEYYYQKANEIVQNNSETFDEDVAAE